MSPVGAHSQVPAPLPLGGFAGVLNAQAPPLIPSFGYALAPAQPYLPGFALNYPSSQLIPVTQFVTPSFGQHNVNFVPGTSLGYCISAVPLLSVGPGWVLAPGSLLILPSGQLGSGIGQNNVSLKETCGCVLMYQTI